MSLCLPDMSINSSSTSNDSFSFHLPLYLECVFSKPSSSIFTSFNITNIILLLPLCIIILYHGVQQWREKRSTSSAATLSHSDCFTYHMITMELIGVTGCICICIGIHRYQSNLLFAGLLLSCLAWQGETFFHVLTCVERYLAVIHPIMYRSLKNERGIRMRNVCIGCVWLLCFAQAALFITEMFFIILDFCLLILAFTIVSFCSFSVLCALINPGPGKQGGDRERVDQLKQRAFLTIVVILGVLVLRFSWGLARALIFMFGVSNACVVTCCGFWINLPSSLVLPLLFLHRAGK